MTPLTIQLPDDIVRSLESVAASEHKSLSEYAAEQLQSLVLTPGSPAAVLKAMLAPPHVDAADVDELEAAIASGRLPVRYDGEFDGESPE